MHSLNHHPYQVMWWALGLRYIVHTLGGKWSRICVVCEGVMGCVPLDTMELAECVESSHCEVSEENWYK